MHVNTSCECEVVQIAKNVSVVGAAAVWDYLFIVDTLPEKGGIVKVLQDCPVPLPGGCAPNIARGLARLSGAAVRLHYPVGHDAEQLGMIAEWQAAGIDCSAVQVMEDVRSGAAWQYAQGDGSTMCFAYAGAADLAQPDMGQPLGEWVVITPVFNQFTRPLMEKAIAQKSRVVMTGIAHRDIVPYLGDIDVLIVNRHEAEKLCQFTGKSTLPGLADSMGDTILYVTCGKKGSQLFEKGQVYEVPIILEERLRDVTGAGDAFTAGVVFSLMRGLQPVDAAYVGSCCSSFVVEEFGGQGNVASWEQVKKRLLLQAPGVINKISI